VTWYAVQAALLESGIGDCINNRAEEDWSNMTVWYFFCRVCRLVNDFNDGIIRFICFGKNICS
jgi:hypothetical protein